MTSKKISIILPTYNEQGNIAILLKHLEDVTSRNNILSEIIVIDDHSIDSTRSEAEKFPIKFISREKKKGLASACIEGFQQAEGEVIVVMDSDLQHPPEIIPDLLKEIASGADIAIASRYINTNSVHDWNFWRSRISLFSCDISKKLFKKINDIEDPMSGFFAFNKSVLDGVVLRPAGYKILLEILILGQYNSVQEIPFQFQKRASGRSKFTLLVIFYYFCQLIRLRMMTLSKSNSY